MARTDVVGSLLRSPTLIEAQGALAAGKLTPAQFKVIEDQAVDAAIALQEQAGLEVLTDGEMRRTERIHQVARYFPLEQLAISPQCGFATSTMGNNLSVADQQFKLRTLVETAKAVWG